MLSSALKIRYSLALSGVCLSFPALASMGNIGTSYGVLPVDIASAQALSMFDSQVSATYYNPSYLARDDRGELTMGLLQANHTLKAISDGGPNAPVRKGDVLQDAPSQHVLIGMKTNLTSLTKFHHPVYLGFVAGVEKYGREMLAFDSTTSKTGQYLKYGRQPLFLNLGGATPLWRGIDAGFSARITLHAEANLVAQTDLAGNTQYEQLQVNAKPSIRPIFGLTVDWGDTLCPKQQCWASGWQTAFVFREHSNTRTSVTANTTIPGTIPAPGLTLNVSTLDSYQPDVLEAAIQYQGELFRAGVALEQQRWSQLTDELKSDTIKDQANAKFKDILIPRAGLEFNLGPDFHVITGVAYQKSPLESSQTLDVNYFDNNEWVVGLGFSAEFEHTGILAYPLRLDFGYQHHFLQSRDFQMTYSSAPTNPYETVTAKGSVNVFAGSVTLKF
ncbi:OmpP1/FadL family transporter [Mangrovitalea sediminis]|uniref:OmpP1/FadL family transporter n=1 Tax=Mangrovitalea sediminis TaxID=1982043 RepID=UPI000BE4ECFD|nr:aromatic hydrocarbon degradation protein [Mangrovitalea sediminis]